MTTENGCPIQVANLEEGYMETAPCLILLTHHKCASNWLRAICQILDKAGLTSTSVAGGREVRVNTSSKNNRKRILLDVNATVNSTKNIDLDQQPNVHFVRDPRDAFVSNYWSWLKSHSNNNSTILDFRKRAVDMSVEDGMLDLVKLFPMGNQLEAWTEELWNKTRLVKYEHMLEDFSLALDSMFAPCGLDISPEINQTVKTATSFRKLTGRNTGEEDVQKHYRKGVAGDWENYFTDELQDVFLEKFGWMGKRLSYW